MATKEKTPTLSPEETLRQVAFARVVAFEGAYGTATLTLGQDILQALTPDEKAAWDAKRTLATFIRRVRRAAGTVLTDVKEEGKAVNRASALYRRAAGFAEAKAVNPDLTISTFVEKPKVAAEEGGNAGGATAGGTQEKATPAGFDAEAVAAGDAIRALIEKAKDAPALQATITNMLATLAAEAQKAFTAPVATAPKVETVKALQEKVAAKKAEVRASSSKIPA